ANRLECDFDMVCITIAKLKDGKIYLHGFCETRKVMSVEDYMKNIAIIGGGWYGCHIALTLKQKGQYDVTLYEAKSDIFLGCSGQFGIRLHADPHYPRSKKHVKVVKIIFTIFKIVFEPSIAVGICLRETFKKLLKQSDVNLIYNYKVEKIEKANPNKLQINAEHIFDYVINCTYYQDLIIDSIFPFSIEVIYQPCLALYYEDNEKSINDDAFSFIIMDGWFPCIMPYEDDEEEEDVNRKYILTHGKYTIMGSFKTYYEALACKNQLNDTFIEKIVKPLFKYLGWKRTIATKLKTEKEFRNAVTWEKDSVIYVISGKINNIFDAEHEVFSLIKHENILKWGEYNYVKGGELDRSINEVTEKRLRNLRNTSELQVYDELYLQFNNN
ncbi:unnamed protein product, partial [Rotaria sp. Silwood2]